nr:hypothetical protein CFP56_73272 [Quercus suber]
MAEELEVLWKKLSFTEEEEDDVELGSGSTKAAIERGKYYAVLKVLTQRSVSMEALRKNLRMMWKLKKEMQLSEVEQDLFLVEFRDEKDKKKVMDMSPHGLKDCKNNSEFVVQNKGELQYGAWLRGEPMRRGSRDFLSPSMEGGSEGRGATRVRLERVNIHPTEFEGVSAVGNSQVPWIEDRGDASSTWDEANLGSPRHLSEKLHKEGKVNLKDGKAKDMIIQISEKASEEKVAVDVKEAQPEASEAMQWEENTRQVEDHTFKFKSKSVQKLKGHETSTGSAGEL